MKKRELLLTKTVCCGYIADDFTGAADLAGALREKGLRVVLYVDHCPEEIDPTVDAIVIATKLRSCPAHEAVAHAKTLGQNLLSAGVSKLYYKYCSTFDSTPDGNIGPVVAALSDLMNIRATVVCPAYPLMGRQIFQGHLFVNGHLLSESGMEKHPLTPMIDSNLVRWLCNQTDRAVKLCDYSTVTQGSAAIRLAIDQMAAIEPCIIICDAVSDDDLDSIFRATHDDRFTTGATGLAAAQQKRFTSTEKSTENTKSLTGKMLGLVGSSSLTTRKQVSEHAGKSPVRVISPEVARACDKKTISDLIDWASTNSDSLPLLVSDTYVGKLDQNLSHCYEVFFSRVAAHALSQGFQHLIVAGGETSTAVAFHTISGPVKLGSQVCPGVPVLISDGIEAFTIIPKSGNFGPPDFFELARATLAGYANV